MDNELVGPLHSGVDALPSDIIWVLLLDSSFICKLL